MRTLLNKLKYLKPFMSEKEYIENKTQREVNPVMKKPTKLQTNRL